MEISDNVYLRAQEIAKAEGRDIVLDEDVAQARAEIEPQTCPVPEPAPAETACTCAPTAGAIERLIEKWEQTAISGASYAGYCHEFVADLKGLRQ